MHLHEKITHFFSTAFVSGYLNVTEKSATGKATVMTVKKRAKSREKTYVALRQLLEKMAQNFVFCVNLNGTQNSEMIDKIGAKIT